MNRTYFLTIFLLIATCYSGFVVAQENSQNSPAPQSHSKSPLEGVIVPVLEDVERKNFQPKDITWQDVFNLLRFVGIELDSKQQEDFVLKMSQNKHRQEDQKEDQKEAEKKLQDMSRKEQLDFFGIKDKYQKRATIGITDSTVEDFKLANIPVVTGSGEQISKRSVENILKQSAKDNQFAYGVGYQARRGHGQMAMHQIRNFPIEALVFYGAIGASMARTAYTDQNKTPLADHHGGRTDPQWMDNLLHQMTSPWGVFSFFAFIIASGQTNVAYSKYVLGGLIHKRRLALYKGQQNWIQTGSKTKYYRARVANKLLTGLGSPLGMAVGMMASNMVHEVEYMIKQGQLSSLKKCLLPKKSSKPPDSAVRALDCKLLWEGLRNTGYYWLPDMASLIVSSMAAHALVGGAYGLIGAGNTVGKKATGIVLKSKFLQGLKIFKMSWVGWALTAVKPAAWATYKTLRHIIPRQGSLGHRFINLYAFMEVEALLLRKPTHWLKGKMKSEDVVESMEVFEEEMSDVDNSTTICEDSSPEDCKFHKSIVSMHKTARSFSRLRGHNMAEPNMFFQNWLRHVSNVTHSFEGVHKVYKKFLFDSDSLLQTKHFGSYFSTAQDGTYVPLKDAAVMLGVFQNMLQKIEEELKAQGISKEDIDEKRANGDFKVVSSKPFHFLDPSLNIRSKIKKEGEKVVSITPRTKQDHLLTLYMLFRASDFNVSLEPFYSDYNKAANQERAIIPKGTPSIEERVKDRLRKKVLAAGIEYLNHIIKLKVRGNLISSYVQTEKPVSSKVANILNPNDIFTRLYKETSVYRIPIRAYAQLQATIISEDGELSENQIKEFKEEVFKANYNPAEDPGEHIFPLIAGTDLVTIKNNQYQEIASQNGQKYYSKHVQGLYTPGMMDFIVASALCGPDTANTNTKLFTGRDGDVRIFLAPRLPYIKLKDTDRNSICKTSRYGTKPNIYNQKFVVNDQEYSSLLHVLLNLLNSTDSVSENDFQSWWEDKVEPQYDNFLVRAGGDYNNIVKSAFIEPLFTDSKNLEPTLSKGIVSPNSYVKVRSNQYTELPQGVFQNLHFEAGYWSDIILYFFKKKSGLVPIELTENLESFSEIFNNITSDDNVCNGVSTTKKCITWAGNFVGSNSQQTPEAQESLLEIAKTVGTPIGQLELRYNPELLVQQGYSPEDIEELKKVATGAFSCAENPNLSVCNTVPVPQQILNYAVMRLSELKTEAINYAHQVNNIDEHPSTKIAE